MKSYIIHCSTGCSCCNEENHYRGPYKAQKDAEDAKAGFQLNKLLASQYAPEGRYSIEEHEAEELPDGRIIIGRRIFPNWLGEENGYYGEQFNEIY